MLTSKTVVKIKKAYNNWSNGNKEDARKTIRGMTKLEIFQALCRSHEAMPELIMMDRETRYNWETFIGYTLDKYMEK